MSLFKELKRRNVLRVGAAYIVVAWLVIQIVETIFPAFGFGDAAVRIVTIVFVIGLIPTLILSWAFEITPEGVKKEKDVDRSQSITTHTGKKLDRMIMVILALALGYFAIDKFVLSESREASIAEQARQEGRSDAFVESFGNKSIAVLPFVNMSDDASNEYFSDGISEELLNLLAKIPELRVISRTSAFSYKGKDIKLSEVARELNVAHILEGSVRKAGNQVRITVQLIEARSDSHLWSETYDRTLDNIFEIQDEIASEVVAQLKITLLGDAPTANETDPQAYPLYLQGKYFNNLRGKDNLARAEVAYKKSLEIDPEYGPAWTGLANTYRNQADNLFRNYDTGMALAREANELALSIDDTLALAWANQCYIQGYYEWNWSAAETSCKNALKLEPGNLDVVKGAAVLKIMFGQHDKAITLLKTAIQLDPLGFSQLNSIGHSYMMTGQFNLAEDSFRQLLDVNPVNQRARANLAAALLLAGRPEDALEEIDRVTSGSWRQFDKALILTSLGRTGEAELFIEYFLEEHALDGHHKIAQYHAWRGDTDAAFEALERSLEAEQKVLAFILSEPILIRLNDDPRWPVFLEKIGLRDAWETMQPEYGGPSS